MSLVTIFVFLLGHVLVRPYINQGLNVFQQLSSISQFFTVFGGLMFVVLQYWGESGGDTNGQGLIAFLILFANGAAAGLYPLYRFWNAWCESGEIDRDVVQEYVTKGVNWLMTKTALAAWLFGACGFLRKANNKADELQKHAQRLGINNVAGQILDSDPDFADFFTL